MSADKNKTKMEHMESNKYNFEQEDPEIIDKELYELQHELQHWVVKNQVSQMFLEGKCRYYSIHFSHNLK